MKKQFIFPVLILLFIVSSCKKEGPNELIDNSDVLVTKNEITDEPKGAPLSKQTLDKKIKQHIDQKGDFDWQMMDLQHIWSAAQYDEQIVAVGYQPADEEDISSKIHLINIKENKWRRVHDAIIALVIDAINSTQTEPVTPNDIIVEDDPVLPIITFKLTNRLAITRLYNLKNVRYIEPLDYRPEHEGLRIASASGCSASTTGLNAVDYTTIAPNCLLPWNYALLNIPAAWDLSEGTGIKVGVIDAGISSSQSLLGSQFASGYSNNGRTITTGYTYGSSAYTSCTHGTSMSGLAVGPRNSLNATTGVAYKSSLHFIRACEDVLLDASSEKTGVKNALVQMGNMTDLRIISMSVGYAFGSSVLKDGVTYAYNKGKLLFAAAGTSFSLTTWWGVVYPAAYSQCVAVTGVKENGSTCSSCHDGSKVKFTVPMERNSNSARNSLSLPVANSTPTYIGGSSAATATTAGIAALVWSAKPSLTREQVISIMASTAQYPGGSSTHGNGNPNAAAAVALALTY